MSIHLARNRHHQSKVVHRDKRRAPEVELPDNTPLPPAFPGFYRRRSRKAPPEAAFIYGFSRFSDFPPPGPFCYVA